jgi:hypothetical protein
LHGVRRVAHTDDGGAIDPAVFGLLQCLRRQVIQLAALRFKLGLAKGDRPLKLAAVAQQA